MRVSREELLKMYPSWNENRHDIVKANYGDIPLKVWNMESYKAYSKLTGTMANIEAVEAYMWSVNGDYNVFRTLIGEVYITVDGKVLGGSISVKYRGKNHSISLNLMYGIKWLNILRIGAKVSGFTNRDGGGGPANRFNTVEMDPEVIEKVLGSDLSDYGESIQAFMRECRELYNEDNKNYIMSKTFNA